MNETTNKGTGWHGIQVGRVYLSYYGDYSRDKLKELALDYLNNTQDELDFDLSDPVTVKIMQKLCDFRD